jgi:plastocyanin
MTALVDRTDQQHDLDAPDVTGDRFVAGAALTAAVLLFGLQAIAGEVIGPLAAFGLIYLGLAVALFRRRPRWLLITTAVLAGLHLVMNAPFFAAGLTHPESPVSFLFEAFMAITLLVTVLGAIGGARRGSGRAPAMRRPLAVGGIGLALVAVVVSLIAASTVTSDARESGDVPVVAAATAFPERVEIPANGAALWITNEDPFHHTLVVEGADVRESLPAMAAVRATVDLAPGSYRFFCDVPGHERMEGELVAR